MTNEEINRYLHEVLFGECWHESRFVPTDIQGGSGDGYYYCLCGESDYFAFNPCGKANNDFFTPDGFFKLWEKCQEQEWWNQFIYDYTGPHLDAVNLISLVNPERLAPAVAEFMKENGYE